MACGFFCGGSSGGGGPARLGGLAGLQSFIVGYLGLAPVFVREGFFSGVFTCVGGICGLAGGVATSLLFYAVLRLVIF